MISKHDVEAVYPLSPLQDGLLFHSLSAPGSGYYILQGRCVFKGDMDVPSFRRAWEKIIERHAVLRTAFFLGETRAQVAVRRVPLPLVVEDWSNLAAGGREARLQDYLKKVLAEGYDFSEAPLMRLWLIRTGSDSHDFVWSYHHVLLDAWSIALLHRELAIFYGAYSRGQEINLAAPRPFSDYIAWLRRQSGSAAESFWRRLLKGFESPTPLPSGLIPASDGESYGRSQQTRTLSLASTVALETAARQKQLTLNTIVQAGWALALGRQTGSRDVVFGAIVSGRSGTLPGIENMVGLFINTLPVRAQIDRSAWLTTWLHRLQQQQVEAQEYAYAPLVEIQRWSEVPRGKPLFESTLTFQNHRPGFADDGQLARTPDAAPALRVEDMQVMHKLSYPLGLLVLPDGELSLQIVYDSGRFAPAVISQLLNRLLLALEAMAVSLDQRVGDLGLLTAVERQQVMVEWNDTQTDFRQPPCVHHRIADQAAARPDAIAVVFQDTYLSYHTLNTQADRLARYLRTLGAAPELCVALWLDRRLELIVGLLAVLKAGATCLPLEVSLPTARAAQMLEEAQAALVLTRREWQGRLPATWAQVVLLDGGGSWQAADPDSDAESDSLAAAAEAEAESLAYLIYTSGSTGRPKAVGIEHRQLSNYVLAVCQRLRLDSGWRMALTSTVAADLGHTMLYPSLCLGGELHVISEEVGRNAAQWQRYQRERQIDCMKLTPTHMEAISWGGGGMPGRRLVLGGEVCRGELIERLRGWGANCEVYNHYGPSECTVGAVAHRVNGTEAGAVAIGLPLGNVRGYVVEEMGEMAGAGSVGELYIGGAGVGRGYINDAAATAERFVPDWVSGGVGERLYRSGDVVKRRRDGEMEFVGRQDGQVKVRGYRVELGEIEAVVEEHERVRQCAAVVSGGGGEGREGRLVCYVVKREGAAEIDGKQMREYLRSRVPEYMVPSVFVAIEEMPLTANGKLDRKRLPAVEEEARGEGESGEARTAVEEIVAGIYAEVLRLEGVGREENFFELGGHSLLATQVVSRVREVLGVEVGLRELFERPTVAGLAAAVESERRAGRGVEAPAMVRVSRDVELPLSFAQQRLWFIHQLDPHSPAYHIPLAVRLRGPLQLAALRHSLGEIVRRHEVLRTRFVNRQGQPSQVIEPAASTVAVALYDLSRLADAEAQARQLLNQEAQRPFDLEQGPVWRAALLRLSEGEHLLAVTLHHVASDGWSAGLMVREFATLYDAFGSGQPSGLADLEVQYADYAVWQRRWLQGEVLERQLTYWRGQLAELPVLELPSDSERQAVGGGRGGYVEFRLAEEVSQGLRRLSRRAGATQFMTLLAGFAVVLGRYSGQEEVVVGTDVANRSRVETEGLIGFFVNQLVLRVGVGGNPGYEELVERVREVTLGAYEHQEMPFEKLVEEMQPERDLTRSPLFQVKLVLQNAPRGERGAGGRAGLELYDFDSPEGAAKFDLTLFFSEDEMGIGGTVEYAAELFERVTIQRLLGHLQRVLEAMAANIQAGIDDLSLLNEWERQQVIVEWNDTHQPLAEPLSLSAWVSRQAALTPDAIALITDDERLSYAKLAERSHELARRLVELGAGPEVLVAICMPRSIDMMVSVLGVLKSEAAYVPVDPTYPQERIAYMLEDAGALALVTKRHLLGKVSGHTLRRLLVEGGEVEAVDGEAVAAAGLRPVGVLSGGQRMVYAIYTSGTTGRPKAAVNTEAGLINRLQWMQHSYELRASDRVLQKTSFSFDVSVWEMLWPLVSGAAVVLAEAGRQGDAGYLRGLIGRQGVSVMHFVPSMLENFLSEGGWGGCRGLRLVVSSGEELKRTLVKRFYEAGGARLENLYGPTECAIDVSSSRCRAGEADKPVSIGRAITNLRMYVVGGEDQRPAVDRGELYIGGAGVGRGYLRDAAATAEKYVPDGLSGEAGARVYRSGDEVRWSREGEVEYLGRRDHQVKMRGYRIELGEIEAVVESYGGVRQCAVVVRGESGGDRRLVAYVVGGDEVVGGSKGLREYVRSRVPEYMVPGGYVWKQELPLSSNGKLDRKRLAAEQAEEEEEARGGQEAGGEARTAVEEIVAGIYAEVLRLEGVGREENFFELGGHSLLATQVVSRVREALGVEVGLRKIFKEPTVAGVAAAVEAARESGQRVEAPAMERVSREEEMPLSYAQQRLWFVEQMEPERGAYNMARAVRLRGRMDVEALEQSLGEIVRRHEVLRTRFKQEGEQALQVIEKARKVALPVWDVSEINEDQREQLAHEIAGEQARRPFDLERGPVWRAALIRLGAQDHVWLTCLHHVASDGWSNELMADEWMRLYETWRTGQASPLPEPAIQYADYAVWQRRWLQGEILERELGYWKRQLAGMEALRLPTDRPRLSGSVRQSAMAHFALPTQVAAQLKELSRREGVTLFMTLLAGFQVLLGRYTGQDDVVVGTDVANRNRLEVETLIGFFVNQLVLRTDLSGNPTVRDLLRRVREMTLGAYAHQDLPFDRLVAELRPDRNLSPTPIFQVLFVMQNMRPQTMAAGTPVGQSFPIASSPSKFDWVVIMQESEEGISADWKYDARLFEAATIERLCAQFRALLTGMPASLEARLSELEALAVAAGSPERSPVSRLFAQSRPRAVTLPQEDLVSTSTLTAEHTAPLVVQPKVEDFDLVEWAEVEREFIEAKLLQYGALLFRGFQLEGVGEFERFAAVLCPELFADYGDLPREGIAGKVYSSTPYPNDQTILFHNESSHLHRWPLKIWFYCVTPPQAGGETPIVDCRDLYGDLDPALAQKFRDKGLLYVRNFGDRLDVNWRDFFKTSDPAAVEAFCRKAGMTCDWGPGNSLRTAKRCVAVADHPKTGERVFFNQLQAHHFSCLDPTARKVLVSQFGEHGLPRNVYYGDGERIPDAVVDQLRALYERRARSFIWQQGDILMVDNMLAAHGRRPFRGPRKIVVAMGEMVTQPSEIAARLPEDNRIEVQYGD